LHETAWILGKDAGTVRVIQHRAITVLRKSLDHLSANKIIKGKDDYGGDSCFITLVIVLKQNGQKYQNKRRPKLSNMRRMGMVSAFTCSNDG
jgi:hypothetical protein